MNKEPDNSLIANSPDPNIPKDEEVFEAFTQGDISALGMLYDRYGLLVYRLIYRMLNNSQEAEDLTQEIFLNLQVKSKFNPERGSFYTYLMTLTRSRTIDRLRSKRSQGRFWQNIGKLKDSIEQQKSDSPMEVVSTEEISTQVRNALQHLSPNQRQILELSYYEGLSQSEIAKRINIPLGTVKTHSRRGLIQLRKNLHNLVN
ncbi:sigma-70 family RNA polymerase sigma factor [Pleurocapsa sp. PCC 7319]|uniref:sigma-70 family RNA polymerase sigma factor n=1 Tax=Pleurocapsa sp. PCC 7319 TaxID=118161 RepID=UPI001ED99282|nr:sigma-70 family RNA polymerase sigma factor [Pleurocapsa sp. PCC 7319]